MENDDRLKLVSDKAFATAKNEIDIYGSPDYEIFHISIEKGDWLAGKLGANKDLVKIGVSFMDLKLGQAIKEGRIDEHIRMSAEAAQKFLENEDVTDVEKKIILNAIEAHHGGIEYNSVESEICTNADCYRFLDPRAIFIVFHTFKKRTGDTKKSFQMLIDKMDEKIKLVSLDITKDDVIKTYKDFKYYINIALNL